jgi:hypothetical protein
MPVGYGWATLMGEAAARAERAARRRVLVYILIVGWGLVSVEGVVDFDAFLWSFRCVSAVRGESRMLYSSLMLLVLMVSRITTVSRMHPL